jgi:hypothetical protein
MNATSGVDDEHRNARIRRGENTLRIASEQCPVKANCKTNTGCSWATQLLHQSVITPAAAYSRVGGSQCRTDKFKRGASVVVEATNETVGQRVFDIHRVEGGKYCSKMFRRCSAEIITDCWGSTDDRLIFWSFGVKYAKRVLF